MDPAIISSDDGPTFAALMAVVDVDGALYNANVDIVVVVPVTVPGVYKSTASIDAVGSHVDRFEIEWTTY